MAVDKPLTPFDIEIEAEDELDDIDELGVIEESVLTETPTEDGGVVIEFESVSIEPEYEDIPHGDNLAELIPEDELESMASELVGNFLSDRRTRDDWAMAYVKGLDLLGMKIEDRTQPWEGASGVFHPMLTEAAIHFQAQAMGEVYPASGPARSKILGKMTAEKFQQATRVENELNYLITERMPDYREEAEQMLFRLALAGSAFKKVYYDPIREVPRSTFVPAEDFVVQYGASSLSDSERYTHVMRKTKVEIMKLQASGFYRDVDLPDPSQEKSDIQEKYDELQGIEDVDNGDDRYMILEMHVDMVMPEGFEDGDDIARPYVVTIDKSSMTILSIRKNWYEDDAKKQKRMHFVPYCYLPGMGFYGIGLIHLIGGLTKSATSILRQLIDAGTLANLPAGLKARGLRIKGDNTPLRPGEFRDVDVPSGSIRDSITFLPYKEPSNVLYQLLANVVEEGRRIGSVADVKISDMNAQAPVGTTLALLERNMKVMSGVQARLHSSMHKELRLIASIVRDFMDDKYAYDPDGDFSRSADFDDRVDVIPVSDPNAATMAQRVMQYQAALQMSQQAPQLYDMGKLHRNMLEVLGIQDAADIIKLPGDVKPKDPVSENMAMLKQEPVKAFLYQDHEAHIQTHMAAMEDPKIQQLVGQSPFASAIQSAMSAHVTEHVAMQYRKEIEKRLGVELPPEDAPLPEDIEVELSRLVAMAGQKLTQENQAAAQQAEAEKQAQDPLTQMQQKELQIKEAEVMGRLEIERERLDLDRAKSEGNIDVQRERIRSEDRREGARIGVRVASQIEDAKHKDKTEGVRLGIDIAKELSKGGGQ
ncbi:hypothetical protein UFOVP858_38 [uncultured Caudovirales phage]|uniref:Uncharacterized protein n=1 Tax=uncultured Caudovirales phage TaxID=2100421 RepID=A0A6J5PDL1_9CAUD|nr:hypothetical protein UFOVP858_38 [uncultured Caudovirales phage]